MKVINSNYYWRIKNNFTGICYSINCFVFFKNGQVHREDGAAKIYKSLNIYWYYKDRRFGINSLFTNKTWKQRINKIKREEKLKLFK